MAVREAQLVDSKKREDFFPVASAGLNHPFGGTASAAPRTSVESATDGTVYQASDPQIVILGVAGSSPVSHPSLFPQIVSAGPAVADVRRGESNADYHSDDSYRNCSPVKTFLDSTALYYGRYVARTIPQQSSDALEHGSLLHSWFEQGDAFLDSLAVPPEDKLTPTGQVGKSALEWAKNEAGPDATVVSPKLARQLRLEAEAIRRHPAARELMSRIVERELSVRWETADGHLLRCRFDALTSDGIVVDLKTTREADILANFWKSALDFRYGFSEAWYRAGMEACGLLERPIHYIVISTSLPHDVQVVTLPEQVVEQGREQMVRALADLRLRESLDWWLPESHGEVVELPFPAHALRRV
jgi:hypothetical protein